MKKSIFTLLLAACASIFILTSCDKEQEPADLLLGHWMLNNISMTTQGMTIDMDPAQLGMWCELSFSSDGICITNIYEDENGESGETLKGSYDVLVGEQKTVLNLYNDGEVSALEIVLLDDSSLTLKNVVEDEGAVMESTLYFKRGRMHMLS
jgi:hypothetical protein